MSTGGEFPTSTLTLIPLWALVTALGVMVLLAIGLSRQQARLYALLPTLVAIVVIGAELAVASLGFHLLWLAFSPDQVDADMGQVSTMSNSQPLHFAVAAVGVVLVVAAFASMLVAWSADVPPKVRFRWFTAAAAASAAVAFAFLSGYAAVTDTVVTAADKAAEDLVMAALAGITALACGAYAAMHIPEDPAPKPSEASETPVGVVDHRGGLANEALRSLRALVSRIRRPG